jgi:hypothetical protein
MTLEELERLHPDLMLEVRNDAAKEERERIMTLNQMCAPGLEVIIGKAIEDGTQPAAIAMKCFSIMKENGGNAAQYVLPTNSFSEALKGTPLQKQRAAFYRK